MRLEKLYILLISLLFVACIKDDVDIVSVGEPIEVYIRAMHGDVTRTALDGIGSGAAGSTQSIRWVEDDQIMVWAKEQGASGYTLDGQTFWLRTYNTTYGDADFVSNLSTQMEEDKTYNYYALYPKPASVTTDPQKPSSKYVSYTIPATQSGKYDPSLDVMVAQCSGRGLAAREEYPTNIGSTLEPSLNFSPLFHLIRIQIPKGANGLGHPVKKLEITFPQNVVGQISFDVTNPSSTIAWSGESNKITVVLDDNNLVDAGSGYIWLHVKPTQINGDVTIAAYSSSGVKSQDITFSMDRNMQARHITPISFSVPSPYHPVVNINLRQIANHLGEDWQKMTLTGLNFVGAAADGSLTITPSNTQIAIYPDVDGDNNADMSSVNGKEITVTYESEHALLTGKKITLPENLQPTKEYSSPVNRVDFTVPYLLEENFDRVSDKNNYSHKGSSNQGSNDGVNLSTIGLSVDSDQQPWSSSGRYATSKGKAIRICNRAENVWVFTQWKSTSNGRFDSTNIKGIKSSATLRLEFNYSMSRETSKNNHTTYYLAVGEHKNPGQIAAQSNDVSLSTPGVTLTLSSPYYEDIYTENYNGSYDNINNSFSKTFANCTSDTRFAWEVYIREFPGDGYYTHWVYIDNIRVSIAK